MSVRAATAIKDRLHNALEKAEITAAFVPNTEQQSPRV